MVQFAKKIAAAQRLEWESRYLEYKRLKKQLKNVFNVSISNQNHATQQEEFKRALDIEVEKIALFFLTKQGDLAATLTHLRQEQKKLDLNDVNAINALAIRFRHVGDELVQLLQFVELNATGIRKILKKHDKCMKEHKIMGSYLSSRTVSQASHLQQLYHDEGISAIIATIRCALQDVYDCEAALNERLGSEFERENKSPTFSIMKRSISEREPILQRIALARRRLHQSTEYVKTIAAQALIFDGDTSEDEEEAMYGSLPLRRVQASHISRAINTSCTFVYMMNYYIVAPSGATYAAALGQEAAFSGIIVGMTPIASLASAVLYSWWANRSYKEPLLFATICLVVGNLMYALAIHYQSLFLAIGGRLLNGFGGARSINRRYIADNYSREERTQASAMFVTASALGMSAGPAIAAALDYVPEFSILGVRVTTETAPGWVMFLLWFIYFFLTAFFFKEPVLAHCAHQRIVESPEQTSLLAHNTKMTPASGRRNSIAGAATLTKLYDNVPVIASLIIYIILKLVLECLLTSSSSLGLYYFSWNSTVSGFYLAALGLLMFPANVFVSHLSNRYEDRYLMVLSEILMTIGIAVFIRYGEYTIFQFILGGIIIFVSTNVLEGVNMALLSKTIPKAFAKGTFNSGLLATEAGTFGRALGDIAIAIVGTPGIAYVLNYTFIPLFLISVFCTLYTVLRYPLLISGD